MSIFEEVAITWQGKEYTVPADQVMGLVEVVEDIITIEELSGRGVKRAKVARAFAAALRYAGAKNVDPQDVYNGLFSAESMILTTSVVNALLALMIPPEHLQTKEPTKEPAPGKGKATRKAKNASASSGKHTS